MRKFLTIWILILSNLGWAQILSNSQKIYIGPEVSMILPANLINDGFIKVDGRLTVDGDLINKSILTNNGIINISGDWNNSDTYNEGVGKVVFNGFSQTIDHNDQHFYELEINGGGEKTLISDVFISNGLKLEDGIIKTDTAHRLVIRDEAEISDGSFSSYIEGPLYHRGVGFKSFPIGKNGNFVPVYLLDVRGIEPVVGIELFEPNLDPIRDTDLRQVSEKRFWRMETRGDFRGSLIALSVFGEELGDDINLLVVAEADAVGGTYKNLGVTDATGSLAEGQVTSEELALGGLYALAIESDVLPIDLLFVPNVFYPFASQPDNSVAKVYGSLISSEEFFYGIYNRWGTLIFETTSSDMATKEGWNGINQKTGNLESAGVFKYVLRGKLLTGETFNKTGNISLVR